MMQRVKLIKISRWANEVAHKIAKFSFLNKSNGILCNSVLPGVALAVMNDCKNPFIN